MNELKVMKCNLDRFETEKIIYLDVDLYCLTLMKRWNFIFLFVPFWLKSIK